MEINEKKLIKTIKNLISEMELSESDMIAKNETAWKEKKVQFNELVNDLLKNITNDKYDDASGNIDKTIKILRDWKIKISKNLSDSKSV